MLLDEGYGGADLAGSAVAALEGVVLDEGGLDGMEGVALSETFDGRDFGALGCDGEGKARVDAAAVDEDGAGSTLAVIAAFLAAGEIEVLAEGVQEGGAGVEGCQRVGFAVDFEGQANGVGSGRGCVLRVLSGCKGWNASSDSCAEDSRCFDEGAAGDLNLGGGGVLFEEFFFGGAERCAHR